MKALSAKYLNNYEKKAKAQHWLGNMDKHLQASRC